MVDEAATTQPPPVPAPPPAPATVPEGPYLQLTQTQVPLDEADAAFSLPDASGRLPIVILPSQPLRVRNELVIGGIIAILVGIVLNLDLMLRGGLVAVGVVLIFLGVFQSFIVFVPEGSRAILMRGGKVLRTIGAGRHVLAPNIIVSRLVTIREIPFSAAAYSLSTKDDVRIDVELLLTFTITEPEKFVFAISAPDFDQVCLAASLEAARGLVRTKRADEMLDLDADDYVQMSTVVGDALTQYGVKIERLIVTRVQPPVEWMESREARRLIALRREVQAENFELEQLVQKDRDTLVRQHITAERERIDLEAANEALRLQRLEERLAAYPAASRQDVVDKRIAVAHQLAGNSRAMVQVGRGGDVADALIMESLTEDTAPDNGGAAPSARAAGSSRSSGRSST